MKNLTHKLLLVVAMLFVYMSVSAQSFPTNSRGIHPPGTIFNPFRKFAALGESGGVPGPTIDGCDLYGFRAQTSIGRNVNLGMRLNGRASTPTLLWGDNGVRLEFVAKGFSDPSRTGCGNRIAYMVDNPRSRFKFWVFGSAFASGGVWQPSDQRLKSDVVEIGGALEIVKSLRGVKYSYNNDSYPELKLPQTQQYGFIAQEVEKILPEAVRNENEEASGVELKAMQYTQIIPVLAEAIKEQQVIIDDQEDRLIEQYLINENYEKLIANLEARLTALENGNAGKRTSASINQEIKAVEGISLRQNFPNPFMGETVIEYTIPVDMSAASLSIYDLTGKQQLNSIELAPGTGEVNLKAEALSPGVYVYTIEKNNQTLARQKMIVK